MFIKCFCKNKNNKIELTEQELKELLDEVYKYGYNEGNKKTYWYTSPTINPNPRCHGFTTTNTTTATDTTTSDITIKSDSILRDVTV